METKTRKFHNHSKKRGTIWLGRVAFFLILLLWLIQTQRDKPVFGLVDESHGIQHHAENKRVAKRIGVKSNVKKGIIFSMSQQAPAYASSKTPSEKKYDAVLERDVGAKMRDGVKLFADVYRPAKDGKPAEGKFPVALTRTIYDVNLSDWRGLLRRVRFWSEALT